MKVLKFGGSSIKSAKNIKQIISICKKEMKSHKIALVFSAYGQITNQLVSLGELASARNCEYKTEFKKLKETILNFPKELISYQQQSDLSGDLICLLNELEDLLLATFILGECSPKASAQILAYGELFSTKTITEAFIFEGIESEFVDARDLIVTDNKFLKAKVDFSETSRRVKKHFEGKDKLQIVTGFIGSTPQSETTTLGRGGSDYTAAILANILETECLELWKDVDGIMTANPHIVSDAFSIPQMTYGEAMELSNFGAKVIYSPSISPTLVKGIPIIVKNTFNENFVGTKISKDKPTGREHIITALTSIDNISIMRVQGAGMVGHKGISKKIFECIADAGINIVSIIQSSSEHSICIGLSSSDAKPALKALKENIKTEMAQHIIDDISIEDNKSILTLVGDAMRNKVGIAGKVFTALGKNDINISAIAQGSSETSISCFIDSVNEIKALNAVHQEFFSQITDLNLFTVGVGTVGRELMDLIYNNRARILKDLRLRINLIGYTNSKKILLKEGGIKFDFADSNSPDKYRDFLIQEGKDKPKFKKVIEEFSAMNLPNSIIVDCTSSEEIVKYYPQILENSIHIVTPNKKANSESYEFFDLLKKLSDKHHVKFLYETNVGASLPIIKTIKNIINAGDKVTKIEAILSGTISYIFNHLNADTKFSEVVKQAQELGFTEPNPADDLNGMDFARKLLILSREIGIPLEINDIEIEPLVGKKALEAQDSASFFQAVSEESDHLYAEKLSQAKKDGEKLKYIGYIEDGKSGVSLQSIDSQHPFYSLSYNDNIICLYTYCYNVNPLVIQGAGAGGLTTASGVFQDIISIAQ